MHIIRIVSALAERIYITQYKREREKKRETESVLK